MKFSLSWLKEHLETDAPLAAIVESMVKVGLEVEHVDDPAERLKAFTIGEVLEAAKHPEADKLRVCKVATKDGVLQIVCGAPNARAGIKVAYAPVGAYVPGIDVTLTKAKIRGVESHGMMCSARELELGEDHDGIIEAPASSKVGDPVSAALGASDAVIEFEVTPNRPDTNGVAGVARDLAAVGLGRLITRAPEPVQGAFPCPQAIGLHFPEGAENACPAFAGRLLRGVQNGPSPKWLADRLRAIGLRPISALVDVTNLLTYDRARPLHVYDADKLKGEIHARLGRDGERFLALDGKTYDVDETMTVIADDTGVLGLGGIIGGEATGCTMETRAVFIESAYFDPLRTAKTGRKLGIHSDARYRFERGVDPAFMVPGLEMATRLILDLCGGEASEVRIAGAAPITRKTVAFPPTETRRLTGIDVAPERAEEILTALGFKVSRADPWLVDAPSWRPDIEGKADLAEEIARITGFDALPAVTLPARGAIEPPKLTLAQDRRRLVKRALAGRGMLEAVTWSFTDERLAALFSDGPNWLAAKGLILANPISSDLGSMRPSILCNLVAALQKNADRGRSDLALFEVAPVYASDRPEGQQTAAGGARLSNPPRAWSGAPRAVDAFTVKADALAALDAAGAKVEQLQTTADAPAWYHPGRSGVLRLGPKLALAAFGELHPRVLKAMAIDGPVFAFEAFIDLIPAAKSRATKTKPALEALELLPVRRDFAFVVDQHLPAADLLKAVRGAEKKLIADVALFDVYQGKGVPEGKKSLGVEVTLQPREKTLTDEEIETVARAVVAAAEKAVSANLRG
ncbi:MAG: phenylalanine--tRNA ligase subunit beta [Parvularculaceae bacterium]|nr:phenylalanine--tRNA ligase subunit beta [Parvularculaceae bacterium]